MPKKRLNKTLQTKPSSSAPAALAASTIATYNHAERRATSKPSPSSVTELINHLRQTQASDEELHRLPHTPGAATVHPSLRNILSVPDTPPPRPRLGNNMMRSSGPTRMRRIPGPPPPASWLAASRHASKSQESTILNSIRVEQSSNLPGGSFPTEGSLQHTVLKAVATNLHWLLEFDSVHLFPTQQKLNILSYVAVYQEELERSPYEAINPFRLLFPRLSADDGLVDASVDDSSEVSRLDLGGAIGRWLSMKEFKKLLHMPKVHVVRKDPDVVPESWDDGELCSNAFGLAVGSSTEADAIAGVAVGEGAQVSGGIDDFGARSGRHTTKTTGQEARNGGASERPKTLDNVSLRFSNLAHLSLALSPTTSQSCRRTAASWSDLLKVAPSLSRLSSLSLAHWPSPTLTPHAASTYTTIKNPVSTSLPGIPYGGSDMYTSYDGDWTEAANLLKILSRHLYCLQWLDLTGCGDWFAALSAANSAEWTGAWRGMQHVGLCVGWQPEPVENRIELPYRSDHSSRTASSPLADASEVRRFSYLSTSREMQNGVNGEEEEVAEVQRRYYQRKTIEKYIEIRNISHNVARSIQSTRKGLGKWVEFDLSPELSTVRED
jgi:hypothetical protein